MNHHFAASTRSLVGWLTLIAQRALNGAPEAIDEDPAPPPTARIDHPTYLRRRIAIDGVTSPIEPQDTTPSWQVRLAH